jgi:3-oxo-4-pregnene-20-carboxyl-CoA dehydrogenase alpha subunit
VDFNLDDDAKELQGLAAELLGREATTERLEAHERSNAAYDVALWKALSQAGLIGACLPSEQGGAGLGAVELAVILRQVGAHVAPVPAFATLALGALPIALHGTPAQRDLLQGVVDGERILTGAPRVPAGRPTTARRDGAGYLLNGVKTFVPYATEASHILIPAGTDVFCVAAGEVEITPHLAATGEPMSRIALTDVRVTDDQRLGDGAWETLDGYAVAGAVATVSGVLDAALKLTTEHVKTREQFGRALAEFQAVTMQIGDVYIAKRALDVAMWAAVWRLANDYSDTHEVLAIAAFNACDPALKALYTCQHLHGGLGLDVTYPLHRFFAWGKHYAHLLGGAEAQLDAMEV